MTMFATPNSLSLSATNSSKSAYCRFKYEKQFFSKYTLTACKDSNSPNVTGQLLTKALLSILKHRAIDKTVEWCDMSIIEADEEDNLIPGSYSQNGDDVGLDSKLILRLHCKHGVVKTHRLILLTPVSLMAPGVPDLTNGSNLKIGPKAVKDMMDHFPVAKGSKSDPQLHWTFKDTDVELRSLDSSISMRGQAQLATELTISAEEFDIYKIYTTPTAIAFHLREFNATIAYADSLSLSLDLRFTDPSAPLFIDVEGDNTETLFVISTSQVHPSVPGISSQRYQPKPQTKKRERDETPTEKNVQSISKVTHQVNESNFGSTGPNPLQHISTKGSTSNQYGLDESAPLPSFTPRQSCIPAGRDEEPLFLSSISQAFPVLTGPGVEDKDKDDLPLIPERETAGMFCDASPRSSYHLFLEGVEDTEAQDPESVISGDRELPPTQNSPKSKMFNALFED